MHIKSSRRNFLRSSAVLGATCMLGSTARPTSGGSSVIVVGAGAFGGWSALQLAQRGMHVTLLGAGEFSCQLRGRDSHHPCDLRSCAQCVLPDGCPCPPVVAGVRETMESETFLSERSASHGGIR